MRLVVFCSAAAMAVCGCKGNSDTAGSPSKTNNSEAAKNAAPRPIKRAPAAKPNKHMTPKVRGRSLDWGTLAKKQPRNVPPSKGKTTGIDQVERPKHHSALATLKTIKPTGLRAAYMPSKDINYDAYRLVFAEERIIELLAHQLNRIIRLPRVVDIQMADCGQANAFYDASTPGKAGKGPRIILCYELLAHYLALFAPSTKSNAELGTKVVGATMFVFFHLLGHALFHQLKLMRPAGNRQDAIDTLATLMMLSTGDDGIAGAFAAAQWSAQVAHKLADAKTPQPFWTAHALSPERLRNILCVIYGSAPANYAWLIKSKALTQPVANTCGKRFQVEANVWTARLKYALRPGMRLGHVMTKPQPRPHRSTGGGPPCQAVANHVGRLTRQAFRIDVAKRSPADPQADKQHFVPKLNAFKQTALLDCQGGWTAIKRKCILRTTRLADIDACASSKR